MEPYSLFAQLRAVSQSVGSALPSSSAMPGALIADTAGVRIARHTTTSGCRRLRFFWSPESVVFNH